ncbi:hypothetical protein NL676_032730 [Syzygium grande]|nr:hypothetical protein NL676_032730 [Syzygium grande]
MPKVNWGGAVESDASGSGQPGPGEARLCRLARYADRTGWGGTNLAEACCASSKIRVACLEMHGSLLPTRKRFDKDQANAPDKSQSLRVKWPQHLARYIYQFAAPPSTF